MFTVVRYFFHMQFKKKRNLISQKETLFSTGEYKKLILEIILVMIIPYPWLQGNFECIGGGFIGINGK